MGLTRNYLVSLLLYISVVNEIQLPLVTCQDEDNTQCMSKTAFLVLLRYPEVSSNLAAYSRTGRVTQDAKNRNDMAHLRDLTEEADDTEICVPSRVYLQLLKDPVMRGDLSVILNARTQKLPDFTGRSFHDSSEADSQAEYQKRSIAMLAKNDDLPISIHDRMENDDDEKKRAVLSGDQSGQNGAEVAQEYLLPSRSDLEALTRDFSADKRNVGTLARDFALPPGRRNIAALVRDYDQTKGNRERMLPFAGKRNVASLARTYTLPQNGKRNVASVARDYGLPYGKRYVGSLMKMGDLPVRTHRSVAALARNSAWPVSLKRGISVPGSVILRTLSRHGRSFTDQLNSGNDPLELEGLSSMEQDQEKDYEEEKLSDSLAEVDNIRRLKRQIGYSDEYPLPVMQNTNVFDYEEMMEALSGQYPNAQKRFLGSAPEIQPDVDQENPADGSPSSDYSSNSSTRSLRPNFNPKTRYVQALHGDCRHGFERFLLLPTTGNYFHQKLPASLRSKSY
ncbi:Neuropeptide-like 1 [Habropoda laboriosa]|uniref:Neuropeptide-like 1 n=1 Tax=Habropoda laboriosa TaxID=597456 RepID=A0A0L7QRE0_9HYME|nr:Neuropeptide-like 1 [Habropoda laboriosa]